jgi:hypothetical protein
MDNFLSAVAADYTATELTVSPTTVMPVVGDKVQYLHDFDDGSISVVTASNQSIFDLELQWEYIGSADHATIFDFYHDPVKANARARTFYWTNPVDAKSYTVRFLSPLITRYVPGLLQSISAIRVRVVGNKP